MKILHYTILTAGLLSLGSCKKFLDVNDNPNSPVSENLTLSAKLPAALISTVNQETGQINQLTALWGGYWGTTSEGTNLFFKEKTYNGVAIRGTRDGIQIWEGTYNTLLYYELIKRQAIQENALYYSGIAKIMQGWHFMRLVDLYNNVPFDEALQGTQFITPTYESGKSVYEKSIQLITDGIQDIKAASPAGTPAQADVIFAGNKILWTKFANTIKLRGLLRQSEANNEAYIKNEIERIAQEGSGFLNAGESALARPGYLNTNGKMNPFWESNYRNAGGQTTNHLNIRPTVYVINKYESLNDPRLEKIYVPVKGVYRGVLFGNPQVENQYNAANTSAFRGPVENDNKPAGLFKSFDQPSVLLSSFESLFLQAEAAQRGWIGGSSQTYYQTAIQESMKYLTVAQPEINTYLQQTGVTLTTAANPVQRIIEQKWLALNSISGMEAWSDFRRTGFPDIPNSLQAPSADARPLRLMYPESERQTNGGQTDKQGNDDIITAKVWWNP